MLPVLELQGQPIIVTWCNYCNSTLQTLHNIYFLVSDASNISIQMQFKCPMWYTLKYQKFFVTYFRCLHFIAKNFVLKNLLFTFPDRLPPDFPRACLNTSLAYLETHHKKLSITPLFFPHHYYCTLMIIFNITTTKQWCNDNTLDHKIKKYT